MPRVISALLCATVIALSGCQTLRKAGDDVGRTSTAVLNATPELRREIVYAAADGLKDSVVAAFAEYRNVANQKAPTYYRLTRCEALAKVPNAPVATIGSVIYGDGFQDRSFRGRVNYAFALSFATTFDFAADWDGQMAVVSLNPQFYDLQIKHDYTPFAGLNELLSDLAGVEPEALGKLRAGFGGPQRWVVRRVNGAWRCERQLGVR